jgi:hypothetical protein
MPAKSSCEILCRVLSLDWFFSYFNHRLYFSCLSDFPRVEIVNAGAGGSATSLGTTRFSADEEKL